MSNWKDHKMIVLLNELPKPVLAIWLFVKEVIKYILQLLCISWRSMCSAVNKNTIIPSFISVAIMLSLFNLYFFISDKIEALPKSSDQVLIIFTIIGLLPIAWMFSVIASTRNAKDSGKGDDSWKKHIGAGFKAVKFFLTYSVFITLIFMILTVLGLLGFIPQIDQVLLGLLSPFFFLVSVILILSVGGLFLGSVLFGGYYLSGEYKESSGFSDKTKSLFLMVARKIVDWFGVSIPSLITSFILFLLPFLLTITALEIMRLPGQSYGVGIPGLQLNYKYELESKSFYVNYPDEYEVDSMKQQFKFKKYELEAMQNKYNNSNSKDSFLNNANSESWGARWYLDDESKLAFDEDDDWTGEKWIVKSSSINYFENNEKKWISDGTDKVEFVGNYHYSFFVMIAEIILIFANALILAFPLSFFFANLGSAYYLMYNTDFKTNIIKKVIGIAVLIIAIVTLFNCLLNLLNRLMI